jgi:hypothetical protein
VVTKGECGYANENFNQERTQLLETCQLRQALCPSRGRVVWTMLSEIHHQPFTAFSSSICFLTYFRD